MAVCTKCNITWLYITCFCHQLVADTIASVYMGHAVFFSKGITCMEMSGII